MIQREIEKTLQKRIGTNKAIVILGARQVGKTTLLHMLFDNRSDVMWLLGDTRRTQEFFSDVTAEKLLSFMEKKKVLVIDEAQRIENIGLKLKIIHDALKNEFQIIAAGSSSFDLANKINEPLTGRKWTFNMFPLSFREMCAHHNMLTELDSFENRLLYGYYPDVVNNPGDEKTILSELVNENLYKDIYKWEEIRKPVELENLARALAYQIGSGVNISELSNLIGISKITVEKYIRLLEQSYIIFRLGTFSRNLRNELKASNKYYFYDVGIRNALIGDFSPVAVRQDIGHLFENFVIAELAKKLIPDAVGSFAYFWRTQDKQEVDFLYERNAKITAYEFKWNPKAKAKIPKVFIEKYQPDARIIHRDNFHEVLV